ncbi:uncharacterized protein UTRI_01691_B [Ustilago trichophora]|uniref:Uncharacterized protein n=1 Tax=Ustilago trichophora TaxID=86804 RepID=A0A5C3E3M7_9BASI|nr:uncharacterized protein UTRI_01691_B [Ustilago trichophora]
MASASGSGSAVAGSSSAQHIDVDIEEGVRAGGVAEGMDEEMGGDVTPAAEGAQTPQSQDDSSDLAPSFYQNNSTKKRQTGSKLADTSVTVIDDDDDLMEPELPGREERLLDEKIRARYIQEIGDIF